LLQSHLPELAQPEIFAIFDNDNSGTIDLKEFLFTMLAFKQFPQHREEKKVTADPVTEPKNQRSLFFQRSNEKHEDTDDHTSTSERESEVADVPVVTVNPLMAPRRERSDDDENDLESRLFFSVFDLDDSGYIDIQELGFIIKCLLDNDSDSKDSQPSPRSNESSEPDTPNSSSHSGSLTSSANTSTSSTPLSLPLPSSSQIGLPPAHPSPRKYVLNHEIPPIPNRIAASPSIGELFDVMDVSKNGEIDYSEFKTFFNSLMTSSPQIQDLLDHIDQTLQEQSQQSRPLKSVEMKEAKFPLQYE
jgi:Ca2+-binding EF-hand superfamily protein